MTSRRSVVYDPSAWRSFAPQPLGQKCSWALRPGCFGKLNLGQPFGNFTQFIKFPCNYSQKSKLKVRVTHCARRTRRGRDEYKFSTDRQDQGFADILGTFFVRQFCEIVPISKLRKTKSKIKIFFFFLRLNNFLRCC